MLSNVVSLPTYAAEPTRFRRVRWVCRGYSYVDPQKEVEASASAVRAGFKTLSQCIADQGGDFDEVMRQRAHEQEVAAELGVQVDTNLAAAPAVQPAEQTGPADTGNGSNY